MAGIGGDSPATVHAATDGRSRDNHHALPLRAGGVPGTISAELVLSILCRWLCRSDCLGGGYTADGLVLGFLLYILHQVSLTSLLPGSHVRTDISTPGLCRERSSTCLSKGCLIILVLRDDPDMCKLVEVIHSYVQLPTRHFLEMCVIYVCSTSPEYCDRLSGILLSPRKQASSFSRPQRAASTTGSYPSMNRKASTRSIP